MRSNWEALRAGLDRSVRTLEAHQAFRQAKQAHPPLAGFDEPAQLVARLTHAHRGGDRDEKDRILGVLVTMVQHGEHPELASALLWLGLWPGLDAVYRRRLRFFLGVPDELVADLSGAFTELVARLDLESVQRVAATLVRSTERDVMEQKKRAWVREARELPVESAPRDDAAGSPRASLLDAAAVERWMSQGELRGRSFAEETLALRDGLERVVGEDAELVLAVLVLDETQREAGARLGLSHEATRKRFQRALRRLREHFANSMSHSGSAFRVCPPRSGRTAPRSPQR